MSPTEYIGFSGHRDCETTDVDLHWIRQNHPNAVWVHGGAKHGFDTQVKVYAIRYSIPQIEILPDYDTYGRRAPLIRNQEIVDKVTRLYACFDGLRKSGGTKWTIDAARMAHKEVIFVFCRKLKAVPQPIRKGL